MTTVQVGGDIDIHDAFESEITLASVANPGELRFRLERPDGTLAADWVWNTDPEIVDSGEGEEAGSRKYRIQFRIDMPGIWYWDWKPDGLQAAFVQGWFRAIGEYVGNRL